MDLLAARYASPFLIADEFIKIGQFQDFATELVQTVTKEKVKEARWQYYLHKVFKEDMSFDDYERFCDESLKKDGEETREKISDDDITEILSASQNILDGFQP